MGKKYSGRRPENQPVFTKPVMMDFEKRRMFMPIMAGSPTPHPSLTPSIAATYTVAASDAPAAWRARADTKCNGTNDHLNIQGALDAGYDVLLSPGTFNIEVSLTLDSYNMLRGCGRGSILTTTTADVDILTATGSGGSEKVGIVLSNFCIDGDAGGETNDSGIIWTYVDYSKIRNVWVLDNYDYGISLVNSDFNDLNFNTCLANTEGISLNASTNNNLIGNTCNDSPYDNGIEIISGSDHNVVVGSTCNSNAEDGIYMTLSDYNTVVGNNCNGNTGDGIDPASCNYNTISGNTCQGNGLYGIRFVTCHNNTISDNTCVENSQTTTNSADDIILDASDYNFITGNLCRAGGETNKPRYGINISNATCDGNKVINNDLYDDGFVTAPYNDGGTGTIHLEPEDTRDFLKYFGDRTLFSGGGITAHGDADGSVVIAACTAWCKETDADSADGVFFSYAGKAKQTLTDLSVNAIYLDYNAGTPQVVVAVNYGTYGFQQDHILLGAVYRQGTTVHIFPSSNLGIQGINRSFMHEVEHHGAHRSSGLVTSDGGSRALSITTGVLYAGLNRHTTTIDGSTWSYWWTDDSGSTWTEDTGISALVQSYNNIASGKVALGTNKYGVHWVYVDIDGVHLHVVYGQGNYSANQAEEASVPSILPPIVTGYCVLIAKIINQEGSNTLTITYPWTTVFTSSLATDHNSLANLTTGDVHTQYILHSLATAANNFLVASGVGVFIKKTLAEVKTLLGIAADIATHAAIKAANATLGHVIVEDASKIDVDGDGKLTLGSDVLLEADLENPPTENEAAKAPTSEWAFDHDAAIASTHWASAAGILTFPSQSSAKAYLNADHNGIVTATPVKIPLNAESHDIQNELNTRRLTGAADATEANKLHDADGGFEAADVGAYVHNTTDNTYTTVAAFVDSGELTLTDDIMADTENYTLYHARWTCTEDGKYLVVGAVTYKTTNMEDQKSHHSRIHKNGSAVTYTGASSSGAIQMSILCLDVLSLIATDYLELWAWHNGTSGNLILRGLEAATYLTIMKVG